jgi:class 3 adenylate cyclase
MSPVASQMVAVLMTDLVGSTAMAARVGPEMTQELRSEHFGLLRVALERAGGSEVKNLGDGLMVVFDSAVQSLACAVAMQQAIEVRNRRAKERLGVRIGVSLGEATAEDGDYFGEPVVESARLCARAKGGQIILNSLVRQLAGSRDGHSFNPLGGLELKGISEPVEAFELQWEPAAVVGLALPERLRELPATAYVGRAAERGRLTELWEQAREGSLRVVLIGGEAGVGKTRLSTHIALQVHGEGATVLYGRCDEDLGVPYQPWVQALGHLVKEAPQPVLEAHVERFGGDLARLVPSLRERVGDLPPPRESDPETERYMLYAAVSGLLQTAGEAEPLLLILDDLHWADSPTLSLLRHVVSAASSTAAIVLGTYRDSDISNEHPLTALFAALHREQGVERIRLTGLDSGAVLALMEAAAGHDMDTSGRALAEEITRETAGNPFFTGEILRHLIESGAIVQGEDGRWRLTGDLADLGLPQSVREVIGQRVERLGPDARTALSVAAVIGRDFDLSLLTGLVECSQTRLLDLLEEAVAASLLQESPERAGRFTFTHALVEHTLYEDLGATRRALIHRRIAEALEEQYGDEPGERLGELAGHWAAAGSSADTEKAIHYARRAAERALERLAPDEAARWYRQALELYGEAPRRDPEHCELLIGLGEAQRQVGNPDHRQTLLDAASLARELGDSDRLCRAVLANSRGYQSQTGAVDLERVEALEAAADALASEDVRRAPVLALLAAELHEAGVPERCRALVAEALEIARATEDPHLLASTLLPASWAIGSPDTLEERVKQSSELAALVNTLEDPRLRFMSASNMAVDCLETGDRSRFDSCLEEMRDVVRLLPDPTIAWIGLIWESVSALASGELDASERWTMQVGELGTASGQPDAVRVFSAQLFNVRTHQGRLGEILDATLQGAHDPATSSAWRAGAALALIESGRADEALELTLAEDFQDVPRDWLWLTVNFHWADVCYRLGLPEQARELYSLLEPFSGRLAAAGSYASGSTDWALGALALTLGHDEQVERHFALAAEIEERFGAPLFLARSRAAWARALLARGSAQDLERAQLMLEQAEALAEPLGGGLVLREVEECRNALAAIGG